MCRSINHIHVLSRFHIDERRYTAEADQAIFTGKIHPFTKPLSLKY